MKKIMKTLCLVMALTVVFTLSACSKKPANKDDKPNASKPQFTADTLPRLDGSTATIPLSEGLVADLLGYTAEQAQDFVHHNTTHDAYVNLINGDCDIIFVTPPSDEEMELLNNAEGEYKVTRVVNDAFVFLVNKNNPVDNLSLDDIKAIYRGEKTNWSQVGGSDIAIIPYQRPDNSGSQTLMYKMVLPADQIMPAPVAMRPGGMGDLIDVVSNYTEGMGALGYSVYYYASGMYVKEGSKLISVNGVPPTNKTIADGSYPLVDGYYAVYKETEDKDTPVYQLLNYILSEDGQKVAEAAGYVPLS